MIFSFNAVDCYSACCVCFIIWQTTRLNKMENRLVSAIYPSLFFLSFLRFIFVGFRLFRWLCWYIYIPLSHFLILSLVLLTNLLFHPFVRCCYVIKMASIWLFGQGKVLTSWTINRLNDKHEPRKCYLSVLYVFQTYNEWISRRKVYSDEIENCFSKDVNFRFWCFAIDSN